MTSITVDRAGLRWSGRPADARSQPNQIVFTLPNTREVHDWLAGSATTLSVKAKVAGPPFLPWPLFMPWLAALARNTPPTVTSGDWRTGVFATCSRMLGVDYRPPERAIVRLWAEDWTLARHLTVDFDYPPIGN